jgi:hypothetical protein
MGPLWNIPFNLAYCSVFGATCTGLAAAWVGTLPHTRGGRNLAATDRVFPKVFAATNGLFPRALAAADGVWIFLATIVEDGRVAVADGVWIVLAASDAVWKVIVATYAVWKVLAAIDEVGFAFFCQSVNGDTVSHKKYHDKY